MHTPITDKLELSIEAAGKRDVPVRLYDVMRGLERSNADLLAALQACLPDLEHYVATHGPGPDRRLEQDRAAIAKATAP